MIHLPAKLPHDSAASIASASEERERHKIICARSCETLAWTCVSMRLTSLRGAGTRVTGGKNNDKNKTYKVVSCCQALGISQTSGKGPAAGMCPAEGSVTNGWSAY